MINEDIQSQKEEALENKRYEISYNSDEWKTVEFHLKSSIASEIKIDRIVSVKNITTFNQFESLANNHLWAYGWYNLKGDDYDVLMKKMREKSFDLPQCGANFKVGAIFDSSNLYEVQSVYVLCKIIIGKSFCKLKQEGEKEMPPVELEEPYESYVFCSPEQSAKSQKMSWSMTKPYSYYINKKNHIEPLYAVFFTHIDSFLTNMRSKYMCAQCKIKEAKIYCQKCVNYYCEECEQLIHGSNVAENNPKNILKHKEYSLKIEFSTRPGKCSIHPERDAEYYCEDCKRTICGYCRFKGAHNKGMQSQHQLKDIYFTFKSTKDQSQSTEKEEKKKTKGYGAIKKILEQIEAIDKKMDGYRDDIDKDHTERTEEMKKKMKDKKLKVFQYIQALREIKRNLLYFKEYFTERENYLLDQKNYPELAFVWSVHKEVVKEYFLYMEEMRKEDLSKIANDIEATMPNYLFTNETFGYNKEKIQAETSNKRNTTKNDGFEEEQEKINYSIIEKTRNLIFDLKKRIKDKKKQQIDNNNQRSNKKEDLDSIGELNEFNEDATTENTFLYK
jgi:hypothetical protein